MKKLLCGLIFSALTSQAYSEPVKLFMYHKQPPFVLDAKNQQGLVFEVAELLNKQSKSGDPF